MAKLFCRQEQNVSKCTSKASDDALKKQNVHLLMSFCRSTICLNLQTLTYLSLGQVISFISIQPYRQGWEEPEPSHVTGLALTHCILGKFLGVVCHCFRPPLDVPTFTARCLYVRNDARDPGSERWNCGRERCLVILPKFRLPLNLRIFCMPQIYDMGPTAVLPLRRKAR